MNVMFTDTVVVVLLSCCFLGYIFLTKTDIALIKNNAKIGSQVASEFASLTAAASRYTYCYGHTNYSLMSHLVHMYHNILMV